jgi:phosphate-selective porin OprO/OprP
VLIELAATLWLAVDAAQSPVVSAAPTTVEPQRAGTDGDDQASGSKEAKRQKKPKAPKKTKAEKAAAKAAKIAPDQVDDDDETEPSTSTREPGVRLGWPKHPSVRFGSVFRVNVEAKFQEDLHASYPGADLTAQLTPWELHRNRVGVQGRLFKHIEFEVEREITEKELTEKDLLLGLQPSSPWKDVNVNLTFFKRAQVQVGKFKVPFGLDELTGVSHNDFVYRSLGANYLAPARDIGTMVHGRFFKKSLRYWAGGFLHDGDNARSKKIQGGDETVAARVAGEPFRRAGISDLQLGTAVTLSKLTDDSFRPNGLRGRTVMTQDTFYQPVYVKGHRRRWEADVDWTVGRTSARAEYTWVSDDRRGQGLGDEDLPDARARAWFVSGTWTLTGEQKERPLKPDADIFRGGIGAVELAGRYERLWYDSVTAGSLADASRTPRTETILPAGEQVLTLGVNWTLNRWIKVQLNAIREQVEDPDRNPVANGAAFWSKVLRFQLVL